MSKANKIPGTPEAWERGELGADLDHAKVASPELTAAVEQTLAMQMISIRLPKAVIEAYKNIAMIEGIGYQPLMREALCRFADNEMKRLVADEANRLRRQAAEKSADGKPQREASADSQGGPARKVA